MYRFLKDHWVAGAGFISGALLLLVPLLWDSWPRGLLLVFLHVPGYMIHQVEEHAGDRFRRFTNTIVFAGREALTNSDVIWINVGGVWGLDLAALYLGRFVSLGWAMIAPCLMLVNAALHIASAIRYRRYNPGLVTSILIFLPLGITTLLVVPATQLQDTVALGLAIAVHIAIALNAMRRIAALRPQQG